MRTGLQRIEENVKFLKSVPLLQNLDYDVLSKIADVLELVSFVFLRCRPSSTSPPPPRDVNLESCYSLFTYNFKHLEPLEAHFRFSSFSLLPSSLTLSLRLLSPSSASCKCLSVYSNN